LRIPVAIQERLATEFCNTEALDFSYIGRMLHKRTIAQHSDRKSFFAWRTIWERFCDDPFKRLFGSEESGLR
jgi:hypothetical protein